LRKGQERTHPDDLRHGRRDAALENGKLLFAAGFVRQIGGGLEGVELQALAFLALEDAAQRQACRGDFEFAESADDLYALLPGTGGREVAGFQLGGCPGPLRLGDRSRCRRSARHRLGEHARGNRRGRRLSNGRLWCGRAFHRRGSGRIAWRTSGQPAEAGAESE
jgi:hypothetical protein